MKDILFLALILACPLGMVAMGAVAWLGAKVFRRERPIANQSGAE